MPTRVALPRLPPAPRDAQRVAVRDTRRVERHGAEQLRAGGGARILATASANAVMAAASAAVSKQKQGNSNLTGGKKVKVVEKLGKHWSVLN